MKKAILLVSPLICGIFGGLFIECLMCILSIIVSPFFDSVQYPVFALLIGIAVLSALLATAMIIVDAKHLINRKDQNRTKTIIAIQILVFVTILLLSWSLFDIAVDKLYHLF